jgi:hypothetical protein
LDKGYRHLITIILNLNHDRYKSYFNYFIILHLGTLTAIGSDFAACRPLLMQSFSIIGIVLAIVWILVLDKIQKDISMAWKAIEDYEESNEYKGVKIHKTRWQGWFPASRVMLTIPVLFIIVYFVVFAVVTSDPYSGCG